MSCVSVHCVERFFTNSTSTCTILLFAVNFQWEILGNFGRLIRTKYFNEKIDHIKIERKYSACSLKQKKEAEEKSCRESKSGGDVRFVGDQRITN